jgi:hypothetical protein
MKSLTFLNYEEIDALLKFIEFHTDCFVDEDDEQELNDIVGTNVSALYDKLTEMRDEL